MTRLMLALDAHDTRVFHSVAFGEMDKKGGWDNNFSPYTSERDTMKMTGQQYLTRSVGRGCLLVMYGMTS
ncbi:hypothetical protein V6N12_045467 [Hibiscus sabdariffa]|uniref:Uncharacterized protein n=1 Tax=Hibiscus sabdariffa TaxID=183260 RepID=A0ABR2G2U2_9ROSI